MDGEALPGEDVDHRQRPELRPVHPGPQGGEEPEAPAPDEPVEELTFIAIQAVDKDGEAVSGLKYRLTLPDGSKRERTLNRNGYVRIAGISPGQCQLTFPDLAGSA